MASAALPSNETERVSLLHALDLLDTPAEPSFDRITRLVARTLRVPIALVSLVDSDRQWFKSRVGMNVHETPREFAFCAHTILQKNLMVVGDATLDDRFTDNPLVTGDPSIRFYAGVPIVSTGGTALGTLCAIDSQPRVLMQDELDTLTDLANLVSKEIQQREAVLLARQHVNHVQTAIEESEARFRSIFERAGLGIAIVAPNGRWTSVNEALCTIVGYSQEELAKLTFQDITHPDDLESDLSLLQQLVSGEISQYQLEKRYLRKTGEVVWINLSVTKKVDAQGGVDYFISFIQDIQARKEAEASLAALRRDLEQRVDERTRELRTTNDMLSRSMAQQLRYQQALVKREAELSAVIENANDAYVCMDQTGVVSDWNRQAHETFGWSAEEAIGRRLEDLIVPPNLRAAHRAGMKRYLGSGESTMLNQRLELQAVRRDGSTLPVEVRVRALDLQGQKVFSAFLHDITARKRREEVREIESRQDALTGLPNRRALFERLPQAMGRSNRSRTGFALLFIDLDGFKAVNDTWGHEAGDSLLQEMARRLSADLRETDAAARLGGDEFTVVLENLVALRDDAVAVAQKLLLSIAMPVQIGAASVQVSASIGIALYPTGADMSPDQLINVADTAMYEAKRAGKSRCWVL
ncbi:MAG: PAS domain S-box protein [Gammaproteobacteria bacterium]|uniref:PAS domain S-box protein n=1 Tax=Rhodoferax sp. TaxID=50421 RepID=UPI0017A4D095|nr:PAS domain S-box protein [Rhodoferax sp.]MBU3898135.1 PAS domain S-box protein [Gammaproteobacteria bacterium]MBA3058583.1 PAS domain S-box protein [Rhodoferax sp.]MBU3999108.1 PAS domain S-box protein [Gammaproteobacteria bacterium]MBU4081671.1 PAS domain S-box protein [Gammaproteobacteria bacterium]MBU4113845.1 PAS domain S-box protein [Gammaproteobacteria bacterium]